jgi:GntR family transcriptional regulator, carbon starvation induced regulator
MARKPALTDVSTRGIASATRASAVYERLRSDIAHGLLEPGSKLRVEALGERYGVGASSLREALSRLSAEGLVDRVDLRGFSVAPLHWDELPILTHNRVQLESLALRESIELRNAEMEDQLVLLIHRLSRTPRSLASDSYVTNPAWEGLHRDFHRTLLSRCRSRWLRGFCNSLAEESYRYRQVAAGRMFSARDEHAEHVAIFEAVIEGRADDALVALESHYLRTASIVADQSKARPAS